MSRVIITLPAYRAERTLERTVADIPPGIADELILVDDASPDNTIAVAEQLGLRVFAHTQNRGYGGNQKTCYAQALQDGAEVIVLLHPDYQYDPKAVPLLIAPILAGYADMTFGSRFAGQGDPRGGGMPLYRFLGNRVTTTLENIMLGSRFTDLHSGLRAYTRKCLLSLPFLRYTDDFSFDSQMLVDAATSGLRIVEVPIPTRYTRESSSIDVGRSLKYVAESLAYTTSRSLKRGRRGRRAPAAWSEARTGPDLGGGSPVERRCILCGATAQALVYPATASGTVTPDEFSCTSGALSSHDDIVQCRSCGMVSSIPTLDAEGIRETYAEVVDEAYLGEERGRRELFAWVLDSLGGYVVPGKKLLEVGSNIGLFLEVARRHGWEAVGYEPSRWAVEEGRRRFGVDLREGALEEIDSNERFDAVVMLDVLEHVVDPPAALRQLHHLVADDGLLTISTVNLSGMHARLRKGGWPWFIRPHLHYFSPETLHATLLASGFDLVEWSVVPRSFHASYVAERMASSLGALGPAAVKLSRVGNVRLPVGWLGDVVLVHARPSGEGG